MKSTYSKKELSFMKRKLAFLGAILLAAFIFTCEGNTYRTHALDEEDQAWIDEAGEALQKIVEEREIMALVYLCDELQIRSEADNSSAIAGTAASGQMVEILDVTVDEDYQVWEKVSAEISGKTYVGYIPRDHLACSDERFLEWEELYGMNPGAEMMLAEENATGVYADIEEFPESYRPALQALKQQHPNWTFVRQNTGLDFQTAVNNELQGGKSLVYKSYGDYCKEGQHSPNWYFASEDVLKLYMDPRNALQENAIFQFEQLTYNESYHTEEAVKNFLEGTFMNSSQNAPGTDMKFYHIFWAIGAEENRQVSPFHLAARVLQEQGQGTSPLISGTYTGSFDFEGKALVEQPSEEIRKKLLEGTDDTDLILYAYDATGENCLWQGTGAETSVADYRFGGELIGLETRPEYTSYEVPETMATDDDGTGSTGETGTEKPQIRIFDGEIQWFDGKYWVSAGNVKEMAKQDPFAAYEENHDTAALGDTAGTTGGDTTDGNAGQSITGGNTTGTAGGNKNSGTIQKPAATPKPMTKPSTPKPGTTKPSATPAPTATPVPAATPAPAQSNDNSSSGGSSDSGSTGGDSGSSGGSDVDMEWTPDLL